MGTRRHPRGSRQGGRFAPDPAPDDAPDPPWLSLQNAGRPILERIVNLGVEVGWRELRGGGLTTDLVRPVVGPFAGWWCKADIGSPLYRAKDAAAVHVSRRVPGAKMTLFVKPRSGEWATPREARDAVTALLYGDHGGLVYTTAVVAADRSYTTTADWRESNPADWSPVSGLPNDPRLGRPPSRR